MAEKKTTSTALTVQTSVPEAIQVVNEKLTALKAIHDTVYKTKKTFDTYNIETETKIDVLVKAWSSLDWREKAYNDACDQIGGKLGGFSAPTFKIEGSSVEDWKADILLRIQIIQHKETYDKLNGFKSRWEELMDKEDRKAMLLKEMESL